MFCHISRSQFVLLCIGMKGVLLDRGSRFLLIGVADIREDVWKNSCIWIRKDHSVSEPNEGYTVSGSQRDHTDLFCCLCSVNCFSYCTSVFLSRLYLSICPSTFLSSGSKGITLHIDSCEYLFSDLYSVI